MDILLIPLYCTYILEDLVFRLQLFILCSRLFFQMSDVRPRIYSFVKLSHLRLGILNAIFLCVLRFTR